MKTSSFSKIFRIVILLGFAFWIQFAVSSVKPGLLFFPAAALYAATFLAAYPAGLIGSIFGSFWGSLSNAPFGIYAFLLGIGMFIAATSIRFVNERSILAHGITVFFTLTILAVSGIIFFMLFDYQSDAIWLLLRDMGFISASLAGITGCHLLIRRFW